MYARCFNSVDNLWKKTGNKVVHLSFSLEAYSKLSLLANKIIYLSQIIS